MDEKSNPSASDEGPDPPDPERSESLDRLVARLAELRAQLETIAPPDQVRARQALDRIRDAYERIDALDTMLSTAREREHELTVRLVRDRARIAEYETRVSELSTIAARVADAEEARRQAESVAEERLRSLAVAEADVLALRAESQRLRSRCAELETDLRSVSEKIAAAAIARTQAARLERERDEARERASAERKLAAADRMRASEAEHRATDLQDRLRDAERRIVQIANRVQEEGTRTAAEREETRAASEPPWIELQRTTNDPGTSAAPRSGLPLPLSEEPTNPADPEPSVIDLRDNEPTAGDDEVQQNGTDPAEGEDAPSSSDDSLLGRLIHHRRKP
jgi:chromosome segregation ATPase